MTASINLSATMVSTFRSHGTKRVYDTLMSPNEIAVVLWCKKTKLIRFGNTAAHV